MTSYLVKTPLYDHDYKIQPTKADSPCTHMGLTYSTVFESKPTPWTSASSRRKAGTPMQMPLNSHHQVLPWSVLYSSCGYAAFLSLEFRDQGLMSTPISSPESQKSVDRKRKWPVVHITNRRHYSESKFWLTCVSRERALTPTHSAHCHISKCHLQQGVVSHTCYPSPWEAEVAELQQFRSTCATQWV